MAGDAVTGRQARIFDRLGLWSAWLTLALAAAAAALMAMP